MKAFEYVWVQEKISTKIQTNKRYGKANLFSKTYISNYGVKKNLILDEKGKKTHSSRRNLRDCQNLDFSPLRAMSAFLTYRTLR